MPMLVGRKKSTFNVKQRGKQARNYIFYPGERIHSRPQKLNPFNGKLFWVHQYVTATNSTGHLLFSLWAECV